MPVITIARQFGAGGETVGQIVAQKLGANLLDRAILAEVGNRLQMSDSEVEARDEQPEGFLNQLLKALGSSGVDLGPPGEVPAWTPPYSDPTFDSTKAVLALTQQVIREAAATGNAVIVGRGAAYLLPHETGYLHVFLVAPEKSRVAFAKEHFGVSEEEARKKVKQNDANRGAYIRQVYGHDWQHPVHYDLVLNTGSMGIETAADLLVTAASVPRSV